MIEGHLHIPTKWSKKIQGKQSSSGSIFTVHNVTVLAGRSYICEVQGWEEIQLHSTWSKAVSKVSHNFMISVWQRRPSYCKWQLFIWFLKKRHVAKKTNENLWKKISFWGVDIAAVSLTSTDGYSIRNMELVWCGIIRWDFLFLKMESIRTSAWW